jgi:hypothetical protein
MRADMAKVIVERPRVGHATRGKPKGYRRKLGDPTTEGLPHREGIKRRSGGTKSFNEHLGPLRRYLDKQVGRPWDKIHAEICARIDRGSVVQKHILTHVADYVATNVLLIDGVPCQGQGGWGFGRPLGERWRWRKWYVCPRTGLLRRVRRLARPRPQAPVGPEFVRVSATLVCRRVRGNWHLVTVRPLPPADVPTAAHDALFGRRVSQIDPDTARRNYGAAVYAVAVRPLGRHELRHYPIPVDAWA